MLSGHFHIACTVDHDGVTRIGRQDVSSPFHLSKPYWDGRVLLVQCVNATAGVFAGDTLALSVDVDKGASVLLTSPSASRIHTMKSGIATLEQRFAVADGAWLEVMPELFIPQAGSRYRQTTRIDVEKGGRLFFVETLAPGRVARGETFAFSDVAWETDIYVGGEHIFRERYALSPENGSLWSLKVLHEASYLATCCVVTSAEDRGRRPRLQAILEGAGLEGVLGGATAIEEGVWVVRMLAKDSPSLRTALKSLRTALVEELPGLASDARKL